MGMHFIHLVHAGRIDRKQVKNLCDIVLGTEPGRKNRDEIVMCCSGGMPIEDIAWGYDCYQSALKKEIGTKLQLWDEPYMR